MDKFAQNRGMLNKLREKTNIAGKVLEKLNPEFQAMMERMRATDEKIRNHATDVKQLVRHAKSLTNRRDYLAAAINFSAFHERCKYISAELAKFKSSVNLKHYKFLLDQFSDEQKEKLFSYDPDMKPNLDEDVVSADDEVAEMLEKDAGLADWYFKLTDPIEDVAHNLVNERGRAFKALEKRFSVAFLKDLKSNSIKMNDATASMLAFLLGVFKKLATAVATRNANVYLKLSDAFIYKFNEYHKLFTKYYTTNIIPLKEQHQQMQEEVRKAEEEKTRKLEEASTRKREQEADFARRNAPGYAPVNINESPKPADKPAELPSKEEQNEALNVLQEQQKDEENVIPMPMVAEFINKLNKFASEENDAAVINEILDFSSKIDDINPDASLKLAGIAEGMVGKSAGIFDFLKNKEEGENEEKEESPPLKVSLPKKQEVNIDLPEGKVEKKYTSFKILRNISPEQIKASPAAINHITKLFMKRLQDYNLDIVDFDAAIGTKFLSALKVAIHSGWVIQNSPSDDMANPRDRQLELYTHINLAGVDPNLEGIAKMRVLCRLSATTGSLMLRTIDKNFTIE